MDVVHVAKLANIPLLPGEAEKYSTQFDQTLQVINSLAELDTSSILETAQVTGLVNVSRVDIVNLSGVLSQENALSQAKLAKNGYFAVPRLIEDVK